MMIAMFARREHLPRLAGLSMLLLIAGIVAAMLS
jgi:hypothetical protein